MIDLYLMRHGIAANLGEGGILNDADRPLTLDGRTRMKQAAAGIKNSRSSSM
ncbi:MAG: hypothetical protein IPG76_06200 [Acidobacteria bacterium]|nr:hypothetical protein [Acidobacteriota bacterium]